MVLQRGFTLLEMIVVMVLMGLVTTLALPSMQRWHDAVQAKAQAATIVDSLRACIFQAGAERRAFFVDQHSFDPPRPVATEAAPDQRRADVGATAGSAPTSGGSAGETEPMAEAPASTRLALTLPQRWRVDKVDDVRFLANGLCRPGSILLLTERGERLSIDVQGPRCGVESRTLTTAKTP